MPPVKRGLQNGILLAIAMLSIACSEEERPAPPSRPSVRERNEPSAPTPGYEVVEVEDGGSIYGTVRWVGSVPDVAALPVRVHREACGDAQPSLALRVSARHGVADAVISLMHVREGVAFEEPAEPPSMKIEACRFHPHVLALGVGSSVAFENRDDALYNVHAARDGRTLWDFGLPERGSSARRTLDVAGAVHVLSDVGTWMAAWVHAFPHPYFAVTNEHGRFRILGIPPGQYVVRLWHEGWHVVGTEAGRPRYSRPIILTRTLSVSSRQETSVDFELSEESAELAGE